MELDERLRQVVEYLRYTHVISTYDDIAVKLNRNLANVIKAANGNKRYLTTPFIEDFARAYSEYISEEWLLTGEGRMEKPGKDMRPHYDAPAPAGFMDGIAEGKMSAEFRAMAIPMLSYDFSIDAKGDSMLPRIEDGDTLLCRVADDRANPPLGRVCVIDSTEGAAVKMIAKVKGNTMTLHSLNPAYRDYRIDIASINRIAEVVGIIREL